MAALYDEEPEPEFLALDETPSQCENFVLNSTGNDDTFSLSNHQICIINGWFTRWTDKITFELEHTEIDRESREKEVGSRPFPFVPDDPAIEQQDVQSLPFTLRKLPYQRGLGWISPYAAPQIDYTQCHTLRVLFHLPDDLSDIFKFEKAVVGDRKQTVARKPLVLESIGGKLHLLLRRALQLSNKQTIEAKEHHIIPLQIRLRSANNSLSIPLCIQLKSPRLTDSNYRSWIPETAAVVSGELDATSVTPLYGYSVPANSRMHFSRHSNMPVLYTADSHHLNTEDFRTWARYSSAEVQAMLKSQLQTSRNALLYAISPPNVDTMVVANPITSLFLRNYPRLYGESKTRDLERYRDLTPDTWLDTKNDIMYVPKVPANELLRDIERMRDPDTHMMCLDSLRLEVQPLNDSGWLKLQDITTHEGTKRVPSFHPSRLIDLSFEIEIQFVAVKQELPQTLNN